MAVCWGTARTERRLAAGPHSKAHAWDSVRAWCSAAGRAGHVLNHAATGASVPGPPFARAQAQGQARCAWRGGSANASGFGTGLRVCRESEHETSHITGFEIGERAARGGAAGPERARALRARVAAEKPFEGRRAPLRASRWHGPWEQRLEAMPACGTHAWLTVCVCSARAAGWVARRPQRSTGESDARSQARAPMDPAWVRVKHAMRKACEPRRHSQKSCGVSARRRWQGRQPLPACGGAAGGARASARATLRGASPWLLLQKRPRGAPPESRAAHSARPCPAGENRKAAQ